MHPNGPCPPTSGPSPTSTRRSMPRPSRVWVFDGEHDTDFLQRIFHKLLINFTWW